MHNTFDALLKQPYWVITLAAGVALVLAPSITIDKYYGWNPDIPTYWPVGTGIALILLSALTFGYSLMSQRDTKEGIGGGVDLERVKEHNGGFWTKVNACEIGVVTGRIEEYDDGASASAVVLPCNEYFDDRCVDDTASALGAYVNRNFEGQINEFLSLMKNECRKKLGSGIHQRKTKDESAESFGTGHCVLLVRPLGRAKPIALVSTTTQRVGDGLESRISYLFDGMRALPACLADERINKAVMPLLGSGHGGVYPPLALVGLLAAIAEVARHGRGWQLKKVTIVLFKRNEKGPAQVEEVVVRRALALIGDK
jgi:hypothetical protein